MTGTAVGTREEAFEEALGALADSAFALSRAAELLDASDQKQTLTDLASARDAAKRALVDDGVSAGLGVPDADTHLAERFRRAWMGVKSAIGDDPGLLDTLRSEEASAMDRLTSTLGKGLPDSVERRVRTVITTIGEDLEVLASPAED
jgi:hypothetical protein